MSSIMCVQQILRIYAYFIGDSELDSKTVDYMRWNVDFQAVLPPFIMFAFSKEVRLAKYIQ